MALSGKQRASFSSWQVAKLLWLAQLLSNLFFGIPLVAMVLFAANVSLPVLRQVLIFYASFAFFVYITINGLLAFWLLLPAKKILGKIYREEGVAAGENLRMVGNFLNLPLYFSLVTFFASFLGFISGLVILWLGLIPGLMDLIEIVIILGLAVGFAVCTIQTFLVYVFLEKYFFTQIERIPTFFFKAIREMKIRKIPFSWKIFFLTFFSVTVAQISLGALYLGRVIIYSPGDIKNALIYVGIVMALTLVYIVIVTIFFSRNLIAPLKKIIVWADKVTRGEIKEEISIAANDETLEVIECLKKMHEELENAKTSLKIKIKARTRQLEEVNEQQEEIIQERIKEIQKRSEELERFQGLAVGRELKMVELKKEIKALKEKLENNK